MQIGLQSDEICHLMNLMEHVVSQEKIISFRTDSSEFVNRTRMVLRPHQLWQCNLHSDNFFFSPHLVWLSVSVMKNSEGNLFQPVLAEAMPNSPKGRPRCGSVTVFRKRKNLLAPSGLHQEYSQTR